MLSGVAARLASGGVGGQFPDSGDEDADIEPVSLGEWPDEANNSEVAATAPPSTVTGALDVRPASLPLLATAPVHRKSLPYPRHSLPAFVHFLQCGYERSHRSRCRLQLWQGFAGVSAWLMGGSRVDVCGALTRLRQ